MDLCKNCGYILTAADLECPDCGTPVGGFSSGAGGDRGPSMAQSAFKAPPVKKAPEQEKKEPEKEETKDEEPEIVKPWAVTDIKKKKTKKEDLSDSFTITKTEVKRKMQLGASQFWRENLKYIIIAVSFIIVIYAVLSPYYRKERIQKDVEKKEFAAMIQDEDMESTNVKLLIKRVDFFMDKRKYDKAFRDLLRLKDMQPRNPEIYSRLGNYHYKVNKDYERAIFDYSRALEFAPNNSEIVISRAIAYEASDDLEKALKDFSRFVTLKPDSPVGYSGRAKVLRKMSRFDKAIEDYLKAIELDPETQDRKMDLANLYYQEAKSLNKKGKRKEAIESLKNTLKYNPKHEFAQEEISTLYYTRAIDLMRLKKYNDALVALDDTIKAKGDMVQAYVKRAQVQVALKNRDKAIEDYQKAYDMSKNKSDMVGPLMELYNEKLIKLEGTEDKGAVINTLSSMIRINPANATLILKRAKLHLSQGNTGAASGDLKALLKIDPSNAEAIKLSADISYQEGIKMLDGNNFDGAVVTFQEILKNDPTNAKVKAGLGEAYLGQGKLDDARSNIEESLKSDPNNARAYLVRGNINEKQGKAAEAKADWQKAKAKAKPDSDIWKKAGEKLGEKKKDDSPAN